ncbi:MAG: DNA-directed RNA polymerase subunit omega [Acutalibacteraceae bacterium]|nr:DNA-directed RNA polymerase subunit omega [Acutalibacteraceae bacterium]
MLNKNIGKLIENYENRYALVMDIANCARNISNEAEEDGQILTEKPVSIAIDKLAHEKGL